MSAPHTDLQTAWHTHVGTDEAANRAFDHVVACYREPHRRYHGIDHLRWILRNLETLIAHGVPARDHDAVVAAAFYHDAIYDPLASDNEAASARLATERLTALGWNADRTRTVSDLILATTAHEDTTGDAALLVDADLAVLGAPADIYQAYVAGVRQEYHAVSDDDWAQGRGAFLANFLERPTLFATEAGRARWEAAARANLRAELASYGV